MLDIVCHFYALKVTELTSCKLRMNVIVTIGSVVGQNTCPVDDDGFIKNCCSLGYNNNHNLKKPGIYTVSNFCGVNCSNAQVYCDTRSGGGGWTVIHRRIDGTVNFTDRDWVEYEDGFGSYYGEFWMRLRSMHCLTRQGYWELCIDYQLNNGTKSYLHYNKFAVGPPTDQYRLTISGFDGIAPTNPFASNQGSLSGKKFSSRDQDNDNHARINCGKIDVGWWHVRCAGIEPTDTYGDKNLLLGGEWLIYKTMEIKIRPLNCKML